MMSLDPFPPSLKLSLSQSSDKSVRLPHLWPTPFPLSECGRNMCFAPQDAEGEGGRRDASNARCC